MKMDAAEARTDSIFKAKIALVPRCIPWSLASMTAQSLGSKIVYERLIQVLLGQLFLAETPYSPRNTPPDLYLASKTYHIHRGSRNRTEPASRVISIGAEERAVDG